MRLVKEEISKGKEGGERSQSIGFALASPHAVVSAKLSTPAPWVFGVDGTSMVPHTTPPDMAGPAHSPNPRPAKPAPGLGWAPDGYSGASLPLSHSYSMARGRSNGGSSLVP